MGSIHSGELGGSGGDLLGAKLNELLLQILKLGSQFLLVLAPELGGLDLGRRLHWKKRLLLASETA